MNGRGRYLSPRVVQAVGMAIIVAGAVFWAVTGHQSALIIGAGVSLVGLGAYSGLKIYVSTEEDRRKEGPTQELRDRATSEEILP